MKTKKITPFLHYRRLEFVGREAGEVALCWLAVVVVFLVLVQEPIEGL